MKALRAALEAACRRLGQEPVEPLFTLSRDEQLLSPVALKLGLDPDALGMPGRSVDGMLVLEPEYSLEVAPIVGMAPRWEALFRMARAVKPPFVPLATPLERHLERYTAWRQAGLGGEARLRELLDELYRTHDLLASSERLRLCRAALSTIASASVAG